MSSSTKRPQNSNVPKEWRHNGFTVMSFHEGFKLCSNRFGLINSYTAMKGDFVCGFAFAVSAFDVARMQPEFRNIEVFETAAQRKIIQELDSQRVSNNQELTYEYDFANNEFIEVENPEWWNKLSKQDE